MDESSPHTGRETPADIDLYCLTCGYNLRGLSGDPRRCPECGFHNPMGITTLPVYLIDRYYKSLAMTAVQCVPVLAFPIWMLTKLLATDLEDWPERKGLVLALAAVILIPGAIYGTFTARFKRDCAARPGWLKAMLVLQIPAAIGTVLTIELLRIVVNIDSSSPVAAIGLLLALVAVGIVIVSAGFHCWKRRMVQFVDDVAIESARETLHRMLTAGSRK